MEEAKRKNRNEKIVLDDVEIEIVKKHMDMPKADEEPEEEKYSCQYLKKRALIDQMLIQNNKKFSSYATKKVRFRGKIDG